LARAVAILAGATTTASAAGTSGSDDGSTAGTLLFLPVALNRNERDVLPTTPESTPTPFTMTPTVPTPTVTGTPLYIEPCLALGQPGPGNSQANGRP
jgi:hypothetical protein